MPETEAATSYEQSIAQLNYQLQIDLMLLDLTRLRDVNVRIKTLESYVHANKELCRVRRARRLRFVIMARMNRIQDRKPLRVVPWFWEEADAATGLQLLSLGRKLALLEAAA